MLENGFVSIHRGLLKWEWYDDINTKVLFLHLLLTVNYEDMNWHGVTVHRGERISSISTLARETKLSVRNIRTSLFHLNSTGEVTSTSTSKYTVFTVVNYDKYQTPTSQLTNDRQTTDKRPTNDRQQWNKANKANKANNKDIGDKSPSEKAEKMAAKKQSEQMFEEFWNAYPKKRNKKDALSAWNKISPTTETLATMMQAISVEKKSAQWVKDGGQFIPYPSTWLNKERWTDEVVTTKDDSVDKDDIVNKRKYTVPKFPS